MTRFRAVLDQPLPRWWTDETGPSRAAWGLWLGFLLTVAGIGALRWLELV